MSRNTKTLIVLVTVVIVAIAAFAAYKKYSVKPIPKLPTEKVKVAYVGGTIDYDLLLDTAVDQGYAKENSVSIEKLPQVKDSTDILLTKNADYILNSTTNVLSYYMSSTQYVDNIKWIAANTSFTSNQYLVSKYQKSELSKIKKVGVKRIGGAGQVYMAAVMAKINPNQKVEYVSTNDDPSKLTLLQKGVIDAVLVTSVQARDEAAKEGNYYIVDSKEYLGDFKIPGGIMALENTVKTRAAVSGRFVKAVYESIQYIRNNKSATIEYIQKHYSLNSSQATDSYNSLSRSLASDYVPNTTNLQDVAPLVNNIFALKSQKDLAGFIFPDFAVQAKR